MMSEEEIEIWQRKGEADGEEVTCGGRVRYSNEESAVAVTKIKSAYPYEAYPCVFCTKWHVGPEMPAEEWLKWQEIIHG